MSIRKQYIETLRVLEMTSPINFYDNKQLTDLSRLTKIKNKFNICDSWDLFIPHPRKHYSILNTEDSSSQGLHWVSVYQRGKTLYVYDSFGRSNNLMKPFVDKFENQGYKVIFVNKKGEQAGYQLNCGMRCLLFNCFVNKYGIAKCRNI